ncbi:MAG: Mur ligase family protein [Hyphomicrobium sp.]
MQTNGPADLFGWDASSAPAIVRKATTWRARGVEIHLGGDGTEFIARLGHGGAIVKSPGIDLDIALLRGATAAGIPCIDELEFGWRRVACPVVGVTGTNGKSTTCALVAAVLRAAAKTCEIVGNTEFGPPLSAAATGNDVLVCEVSSFQLEASPTFLPAYAIFTNLSPEHLTRHATMADYGAIKSRMFIRADKVSGTGIVNIDDPFGAELLTRVRNAGGRAISYGAAADADVRICSAEWDVVRAHTVLGWQGRTLAIETGLPGRHNAHNIAAAFAFGVAAGIDPVTIASGLERATAPPGRWQVIASEATFDVVVDYAHTPDGLVQVLSTARAIVARRQSRLHTVFGPVGLPDAPKAAGCAAALAEFGDHVILTTGSAPRSARIPRIKQLHDRIKGQTAVEIVLSRAKAIAHAIAAAAAGDIVLILGIGALGRLIVDARGTAEPFDDRVCAARLLEGMSA